MERLQVWFTRTHASITVVEEGGVNRETSSRSMVRTLQNMNGEDREMFVRFCKAVIECTEGDCKRLTEW